MRQMGKGLLAALLTMGLAASAFAESLELGSPLSGVQAYPEGVSQEQATYLFQYEYPQFLASTDTDQAINAYYQAVCKDMGGVFIPQNVEEVLALREEGAPSYYTDLQYQITANTREYVSVLLSSKQFLGNGESESIQANVFARDGLYAGRLVILSQVMGLEQEGDEFEAKASYASQLAYQLVWQIMQQEKASMKHDFIEGLTRDGLEAVFAPETDFYMDAEGNLVFFLQAGTVAGEVEGILTYPFSMAELLTAAKK